jgi:hypothetical protein
MEMNGIVRGIDEEGEGGREERWRDGWRKEREREQVRVHELFISLASQRMSAGTHVGRETTCVWERGMEGMEEGREGWREKEKEKEKEKERERREREEREKGPPGRRGARTASSATPPHNQIIYLSIYLYT